MAGRNVRFLAKAPLFSHPLIGWLVRGVGSVPVYRQQDDPTLVSQNLDSFRDVHRVLAAGDVVGIFPEGISHSASRLAPLKTGAARMAIGAAAQLQHDFPIIAVGLVFRDRDAFRSEAHVIVGEPFAWNDLVRDVEDRTTVRALTDRIEQAMRRVSVNLEQWEDEPLVRTAEAVWRAEFGAEASPVAEVERLRIITEALRALRSGTEHPWRETALELRAHGRALRKIDLTPEDLVATITTGGAARWMLRKLPLVPFLPISLLGALFFWVPKQVAVWGADWTARREGDDTVVTHRILVGAVTFPFWILITSIGLGRWLDWSYGLLFAMLQPVWAFAALAVGERRQSMWTAIRRYMLRRFIGDRLDSLRAAQRELAEKLRRLLAQTSVAPTP